MSSHATAVEATAADYRIAARIERLPLSTFHLRVGAIIGSSWFFDGFDALAIAYVLPVLIGLWKLAPSQIGILISVGYLGQTIGSVYFGWLAERVGRVPCTLFTLLIWSVMSFACAFAWDYHSLLAMRFLQGLGLGGEIPIMATYINEFAKAERRGRFSLGYQVLFSIGLSVVAIVASWVVPAFGWRWMFVIGAVPAFLAVPLRRILPKSPRWLASRGRLVEADRVLSGIEATISRNGARPLPPIPDHLPQVKPSRTRFSDLFKGIYRRRTFTVWVMWVCTYLVIYGLTTWLPSLWRTVYHLSVQQSLNYSVVTTLVSLVGALASIVFIDLVGRKPLFATAQLVSCVPLLYLAAHTHLGSSSVLALVSFGLVGNSVLALSLSTYTAEIYPTEMRALGTGVGNAWLRAASVVGPFLIGSLLLPRGGTAAIFVVMGLASLIGGLTTLIFAVEPRGKVLEQLSPSL